MARSLTLLVLLFVLGSACGGTKNVADCASAKKPIKCDKPTEDEQAQAALNADPPDFDTAITLLNDLIAQDPTDYHRHPLLAAAYAGRAGLDILNIAKAQFGGSTDIVSAIEGFISCPSASGAGYKLCVADMKAAGDVLRLIPADVMANTADPYATSATLQLTIYAAAYPVMFLKEFTTDPTTGTPDLSQLQNMSPADAVTFISALAAAGQVPAVAGDPGIQTQVNAAVAQINAEPGATQQAQIAAFVAAHQGSGTATSTDSSTDSSTDTSTGTSTGA